jgi:hypothetical protein
MKMQSNVVLTKQFQETDWHQLVSDVSIMTTYLWQWSSNQMCNEFFLQCIFMPVHQVSNTQEENLSPLLTGGFVPNFPKLQYANINY